jgi:NDP-sugar pyrophosphorylase family protein
MGTVGLIKKGESMSTQVSEYFDLSDPELNGLIGSYGHVWEIVPEIPTLVDRLLEGRREIRGRVAKGVEIADGPMYVHESARIEPGVFIAGPTYVGPNVTIRQGAYVRTSCAFLERSLLGHASEAKASLFLPGAKAPHFAYVGDSVLGHRVNLGAGTRLSNATITRGLRRSISIDVGGISVDTGLRKLGAIIGDDVEIGCNSVLNPGAIIGKGTLIYPGLVVPKGLIPARVIMKLRQEQDSVPIMLAQ